MDRPGNARRRAAVNVDFTRAGFASVLCAASLILAGTHGAAAAVPGAECELAVAFAVLVAGSALIMRGVWLGGARPRGAAAAVLMGPERVLPLLFMLLFSLRFYGA